MADTPKESNATNDGNSTQKDTAKDIYGAGTKTFYDTIGNYLEKNGADATSKSVVGNLGGLAAGLGLINIPQRCDVQRRVA